MIECGQKKISDPKREEVYIVNNNWWPMECDMGL